MYLPILNGADEGNFAIGIIFLISGIKGQKFWTQNLSTIDYPLNKFIILLLYLYVIVNTLYKFSVIFLFSIYNIGKHKLSNVWEVLKQIPFLFYILGSAVLYYVSLTKSEVPRESSRNFIYIIGFSTSILNVIST